MLAVQCERLSNPPVMLVSTPLAVGLGEGGEIMRPLALTVGGGLLVSMLLTLFLIPCGYLTVSGAAQWLRSSLPGACAAA